jgi:PAS domain S-box-containing protein
MWILDPNTGQILDANQAAAQFYGWSIDQLKQMRIHQINTLAPEEIDKSMSQTRETKKMRFEFRHRRADGSMRDVVVFSNEIEIAGTPLLYAIIHDITDRKLAEQRVIGLLEEKEFLFKEVHHRVKNNLNTVASLLSLQSDTVTDPAAIAALKDAERRVRSMSLISNKLFESPESDELQIGEYLSPLIDQTVANFPNAARVRVEKNIQEFIIDSKKLSAIGILVNELLTNIMKYAFAGREKGLISVSVSKVDTLVTLTVQDDGVGIPSSVKVGESSGFGLQLVDMLTHQLDGRLLIGQKHGTQVILAFEV